MHSEADKGPKPIFVPPLSPFMNKSRSFLLILSLLAACNHPDGNNAAGSDTSNATPPETTTAVINYTVMQAFPHDTSSLTEGLLFHDGQLYESTGTDEAMPENRKSLFGAVNLSTGKIDPKAVLDRTKYFGEGIVFLNGKVYELTYTTRIGFIYDAKTFKKLGDFTFPSKEGWGMTTNGAQLIMSDGTSNITYLDPNTFNTVKILGVT